ncbi:hypothetical protein D3C71_1744330 [compost metagenome]
MVEEDALAALLEHQPQPHLARAEGGGVSVEIGFGGPNMFCHQGMRGLILRGFTVPHQGTLSVDTITHLLISKIDAFGGGFPIKRRIHGHSPYPVHGARWWRLHSRHTVAIDASSF